MPTPAALPVQAIALPSNQTEGAWTKLVHQDAERKRGSAQQEGADGETQVQHLLLVHAAEPFFCLFVGRHVAQRHDHGVVLCGERGRAWLQERDIRTLWSPQGAGLAQDSVFCPLLLAIWIPSVNYSPPWLVATVTLWDKSVMQHTHSYCTSRKNV